jgi:multiple sugar transport system substrate-binding protein
MGSRPVNTTTSFTPTSASTSVVTSGVSLSGSITVLLSSGDPTLAPYFQLVASDFMAKYPNVKVQLQIVPFAQLVTTAMTSLQSHNPSPDIIIFYPSQAPTLGPYLLDIRKYLDNGVINKTDIPASSMNAVYLLDKVGQIMKVSGVPFQQVFGYVLVYQKSIFQDQALKDEFKNKYGFDFDPHVWNTWDKLITGAQFIQSKGLKKYALLFPDGLTQSILNGYVGIFYSYAVNDTACTGVPSNAAIGVQGYWTYFKMVNGKVVPTLNCTAGIKALETHKALIQFQPPITVQAMEYDQLRDLFLTGDYAMVAAWTSFIPIYNNANISKVAGNIDIVPLPGGATGQAPTYAGINPFSNNPDLAAKFIAFFMSPEEYKKGIERIGFLPATYSGLEIASSMPQTSWVKPFYESLKKPVNVDLQRLAIYNSIQNFFTDLRPIFINEVAKYFRGEQSAQDTMNNIVSQWLKIMKYS